MDPLTIAKIGATVMGGIGAFKRSKQKPGGQMDLGRLRKQAEKHGFNPLTVLQNTGGAGFTTPEPKLPVMSILGQSVGTVADTLLAAEDRAQADEYQDAQLSLMAAQEKRLNNPVQPRARPSEDENQYAGMKWDEIPYVRVFTGSGREFELKANIAERLRIEEGGYFMAEDFEALAGDIGQEVFGASWSIDQLRSQLFDPSDRSIFRGIDDEIEQEIMQDSSESEDAQEPGNVATGSRIRLELRPDT